MNQKQCEDAEIALLNEAGFYNEERSNMILKMIKKHNIKSIYDIGCGTGKITKYLSENGIKAEGVDISKRLIKIARKESKVKYTVGDIYKIKPTKKYDAVLFAGVLEHIKNDADMIRESKKFLKKNGKIVITDCPCFQFLWNKREKRIGHIRRYSKREVIDKLNREDFKILEIKYWNFLMLVMNTIMKYTNKDEYSYDILTPTKKKLLTWWYRYIENNFIILVGDRLIVVGETECL